MKCYECGSKITMDDSLGAEVATRKRDGEPIWKDVCRECYDDIVRTCQICGEDDVMPSDVSEFILVKHELAGSDRPPGIYQILRRPFLSIPIIGGGSMNNGDVLFVDKLPKPDHHYDISGNICNDCAKPYAKRRREVYGRKDMTRYWNLKTWQFQREHVRNTAIANPDMLRDLECDKDGYDWEQLQELFCLPPELPTYHEWVLLKYRGVTIYKTHESDQHGDSWLLLRPEPKYRRMAYGGGWDASKDHPGMFIMFTVTSMPTFPEQPEEKPGEYRDHYYWARQHSIPAIRKAIKLGLIKQNGTFDKDGKPHSYG